MNFYRSYQKPTLLLWAILLSITLLCTQHLQIHIHSLDHETSQHHDNLLSNNSDHSHMAATKHLSFDSSHPNHHDDVMAEMSASPDSIVQLSSTQIPSIDLLILYILLFALGAYRSLNHKIRPFAARLLKRYFYLIPQLRAPPYSS